MKSVTCALSLACFLFVFCGGTKVGGRRFAGGYYWREYTGDIPSDAIHGGLDKEGRITYIGQALHEGPAGRLIPGGIYPTQKQMIYFFYDHPVSATLNVKILCSPYPEDFEWLSTNITELQSFEPKTLVLGGYDTTYPHYIGRIHAEGELVVGKVTIPKPNNAFAYAVNGKGYYVQTPFEILSYKVRPHEDEEARCPHKIVNIDVHF